MTNDINTNDGVSSIEPMGSVVPTPLRPEDMTPEDRSAHIVQTLQKVTATVQRLADDLEKALAAMPRSTKTLANETASR